jgi:hypothetical protein
MPFVVKTRYGAEERYEDDADIPAVVDALIQELETEHDEDEPDDEHTQVAISNGDWAVTVQVSGLMTLDDLGWITGSDDDVPSEELFIRADSRRQAIETLTRIAQGDVDGIRSESWTSFDQVPPSKGNLFRQKKDLTP